MALALLALLAPGPHVPRAAAQAAGGAIDSTGLIHRGPGAGRWRPRPPAPRGAIRDTLPAPLALPAGEGGGRSSTAFLYGALDSAAAFPLYPSSGSPDPRFGPGSGSDSTPPATIAYPRPRPITVMLRSAILPGWGQWTNGHGWKGLLAAGLEGFLASRALRAGHDVRAGRDSLCAGFPGTSCDSLESALRLLGDPLALRVQDSRDRRTAFWWWTAASVGVSMLDAYVDAHFRDFDVRPVALVDPATRRARLGIAWAPRASRP